MLLVSKAKVAVPPHSRYIQICNTSRSVVHPHLWYIHIYSTFRFTVYPHFQYFDILWAARSSKFFKSSSQAYHNPQHGLHRSLSSRADHNMKLFSSSENGFPTRQIARLQGQEPETPVQPSNPAPHQSARLQGRALETPAESLLPAWRFAEVLENRIDLRNHRIVEVDDDCPICMDPLENANHVARCYYCCMDYYNSCISEWFNVV